MVHKFAESTTLEKGKKMRDCMLDLETFGKTPGCAIRSVGAVMFDPTSEKLGEEFYANVTRESCEERGLTADADTVKWWDSQSDEARSVLDENQRTLGDVLVSFRKFWIGAGAVRVWSQGANFDQPIIEEAMRRLAVGVPWKFWDSRCTRTAYGMAGLATWDMPKNRGVAHYALDDARHQARCVQLAYRRLKINHE